VCFASGCFATGAGREVARATASATGAHRSGIGLIGLITGKGEGVRAFPAAEGLQQGTPTGIQQVLIPNGIRSSRDLSRGPFSRNSGAMAFSSEMDSGSRQENASNQNGAVLLIPSEADPFLSPRREASSRQNIGSP
jgi:hypothetical protein